MYAANRIIMFQRSEAAIKSKTQEARDMKEDQTLDKKKYLIDFLPIMRWT